MARADYDGPIARGYNRGRSILPETLRVWRDAIAPYVGTPGPVLDLGAGTTRFSSHLAEWFDSDVVAVEPAEGMRSEATPGPGVSLVGGRAEQIPLRDASVGVAWLSNVSHHFSDLDSAAQEIRRVVRPGGPVLMRGGFPDVPADPLLFRYFPDARLVFEDFPTLAATLGSFRAAGFELERQSRLDQVIAQDMQEYYEKVSQRADSTLDNISDEAWERGLANVKRDAESERAPTPVTDPLDFLVLR